MKTLSLILFCLSVSIFVTAQTINPGNTNAGQYPQFYWLKGHISDIQGQNIEFATVTVKNTRNSTSTDQAGYFRIKCSVTDTVLHVDFNTQCSQDFIITVRDSIELMMPCGHQTFVDPIYVAKEWISPITGIRQLDSLKEKEKGDIRLKFRISSLSNKGKYKIYLKNADEIISRKKIFVRKNEKDKIILFKNIAKGEYVFKIIRKKKKIVFERDFVIQ